MKIDMKQNKTELNVDVIGGMGPLTEKEELELSLFFQRKKLEAEKVSKIISRKTAPKAKVKV